MRISSDSITSSAARSDFHQRLSELREPGAGDRADILERFTEVEDRFAVLAFDDHARLLECAFVWTQAEHDIAAWLQRTSEEVAILAYRLCEWLARKDARSTQARHMAARALLHRGNAAKWDGVVHSASGMGFWRGNAVMRWAMAGGFHREPVRVALDDRMADCTLESLYFRALLLERFSSGTFSFRQLEILDQWMWLWTPVLKGESAPPEGGAFSVNLATSEGLRPGAKPDCSTCLYLPVAPIQRAYAAIVAEFHAGRIVPAEGAASRMRLEEHVAVLEIARRGLQAVGAAPARAVRVAGDAGVGAELFVGLGEIIRRGFAAQSAPVPAAPRANLALVSRDGQQVARDERVLDFSVDNSAYERRRLLVRITNASMTGFGIEGEARDLGQLLVGDLVVLRLSASPTPQICKVARRAPSPGSTRVIVGLQRISTNGRLAKLSERSSAGRESSIDAVFVSGADASGRHDAFLVSERDFAKRAPIELDAGGRSYTIRFNRARMSGPGWVLAGFEVLGVGGKRAA